MFNVNDYKISRAIVALEREVNYLNTKTEMVNTTLIKQEIKDDFIANDIKFEFIINEGSELDQNYNRICFGKVQSTEGEAHGMFVGINIEGFTIYSTDGKQIEYGPIKANDTNWYDVCYGNNVFIATGTKAYTSDDGIIFNDTDINGLLVNDICYGKVLNTQKPYNIYLGVGDNCNYWWSKDDLNFTNDYMIGTSGDFVSICYGNGIFVAVAMYTIMWAQDETGFKCCETDVNGIKWTNICYGNGVFVVVSRDGWSGYSTDGNIFTLQELHGMWKKICYGNGIFIAIDNEDYAWSTDGKNFDYGKIGIKNVEWEDMCYGNGVFLLIGKVTGTDKSKYAYITVDKLTAKSFALKNQVYTKEECDEKFGPDSSQSQIYSYVEDLSQRLEVGTIMDYGGIRLGPGYAFGIGTAYDKSCIAFNGYEGTLKMMRVSGTGSYLGTLIDMHLDSSNNIDLILYENAKLKINGSNVLTEDSQSQQSHTITHLCPVDENEDINSFVIGTPVYMTGNVYVKQNNKWNKSISTDSIDCIPSVKTSGTWREYLGICTHILPKSKEDNQPNINEFLSQKHDENEVLNRNCGEIKFASHGDYMIKVSNSSEFKVGDIVYLNENGEGKLEFKVLTEDVVLTAKINKLTVGTVTGIIDETTLSVFKE